MDHKPTLMTSAGLNEVCQYALDDELIAVKKIMDSLKTSDDVVMIGAGPGVFALAMLEDRRDPPYLHIVDHDTCQWVQTHLEASNSQLNKVEYVLGDSSSVGKEWQGDVNFLLVDGDHSYEGVRKDIDAWLPRVVKDGFVFFHDWFERPGGFNGVGGWITGGVARAVNERRSTEDLRLLSIVGISAICTKV